MNPEFDGARLERLEANVAHLDRLADQLNEALIEQGRLLARLQKRVDQLAEVWEARAKPAESLPAERPPHYGR